MGKIRVNDPIQPRELTSIQVENITVRCRNSVLIFCAGCNLHLRPIAKKHDEIPSAGVCGAGVCYSSAHAMKPHQGDLLFAAISDPNRLLYEEFGVLEIEGVNTMKAEKLEGKVALINGRNERHRLCDSENVCS